MAAGRWLRGHELAGSPVEGGACAVTASPPREAGAETDRTAPNPPPWSTAWIGLGANLGEAIDTLQHALGALMARSDARGWRVSSPWASAPIASTGPDYVNAVAVCATCLSPEALLAVLQGIELAHGRQRPYRNAPRTLDLDLLMHGDRVQHTPELVLPHPRLHQRAFVIEPMLEIEDQVSVPGVGPLRACRAAVADQRVRRMRRPPAWPEPVAGA
jgi:2-amino-4-hydroxy-6-hydroxymethyldihydropteridine diphosphokinase